MVGLPDSSLSEARICNLSAGGLKFNCRRHTVDNILPENSSTPIPLTGIALKIHFELPQPNHVAHPIQCEARVIHFERLAQDDFHVGLQFTSMDKATKKALNTYLDSIAKNQDG